MDQILPLIWPYLLRLELPHHFQYNVEFPTGTTHLSVSCRWNVYFPCNILWGSSYFSRFRRIYFHEQFSTCWAAGLKQKCQTILHCSIHIHPFDADTPTQSKQKCGLRPWKPCHGQTSFPFHSICLPGLLQTPNTRLKLLTRQISADNRAYP